MKEPKFYTSVILRKIAPLYCRGVLVDVGAGYGKYGELLKPFISKYVAVDNLSSSYQYKQEADKTKIDFVASAEHLPFPDNFFDSALCTKVIEHVEDPLVVLREIKRIIKPDAYLILSSDWFTPFHQEPKDYWRFSLDGYKYLADKSGFIWIDSYQQGGIFVSINYIFWRTMELHGGALGKKIYRLFLPLRRLCEHISGALDRIIKTPDGVGHVVVLKK